MTDCAPCHPPRGRAPFTLDALCEHHQRERTRNRGRYETLHPDGVHTLLCGCLSDDDVVARFEVAW
jgi:hypothetical protein